MKTHMPFNSINTKIMVCSKIFAKCKRIYCDTCMTYLPVDGHHENITIMTSNTVKFEYILRQ